MRKPPNKLLLFPLVACLLVFAACPSRTEKEIAGFLDQCSAAVTRKDPRKFLNCFAPGYSDPLFPAGLAAQNIQNGLAGGLAPSYQLLERKMQIQGSEAQVDQSFRLEGLFSRGRRSCNEREKLRLRREGRGWRIVSGSVLYQLLAGRPAEEDQIRSVLEKRVRALREKDLGLFKEIVDPEYDFKGRNFKQVIAQRAEDFKNYRSIELTLDRPRILFRDGGADVTEGYRLVVDYRGEQREFNDTEKLGFRKTEKGWKISQGL